MTIIFQLAFGSHVRLMQLAVPYWLNYARAHRVGYHTKTVLETSGNWRYTKHKAICAKLAEVKDGDTLLYLDVDVIAIGKENIAEGLPSEFDMAMCPVKPEIAARYGAYNSGVQYIRVNQSTREFYHNVLATGCEGRDILWDDQREISNRLLRNRAMKFVELNARYNYYSSNLYLPMGAIQIKAFHGKGPTIAAMEINRIIAQGSHE